jgi:hypothetical protein
MLQVGATGINQPTNTQQIANHKDNSFDIVKSFGGFKIQ